MTYFIIKTGYNANDFISIDNLTDLEKAQFAFLTNAKVMFSNGEICRGQDIISIKEDWHKEMGWNPAHKMQSEDWEDLKARGVEKKYIGVLAAAKESVYTLMKANRTDLIGQPGSLDERIKMLA